MFALRPQARRLLLLAAAWVIAAAPSSRADPASGAYADLSARLDAKIAQFDWAGGELSLHVVDLRHGITAFTRDADTARRPGPAAKLVTAAAALERLGPEFTFSTELFVRGEASKGRLMGDLLIRGDGDPTLTSRAGTDPQGVTKLLDRWASLVRKEGVSRIEGSIWVDASAFDDVPYAAGWAVESIADPDVPEISALNLNDNTVEVYWTAGKKKEKIAQFLLFPPVDDYLYFSNNVRVDGGGRDERAFFRRAGQPVIAIEGRIPVRAQAHNRVTVPQPPLFFGHVVKTRLKKDGVELVGGVADWKTADLGVQESRRLRRIDLHASAPLRLIIPGMLAEDRTVDAESLFKTLGRRMAAEGETAVGTFENGSEALTDVLSGWGISTSGVVFVDGSGLSSFDRIPARKFVAVLAAVRRSSFGGLFEAATPRISLEAALRSEAAEEQKGPPRPEPVVFGMLGAFPQGQAAAGWAQTRGRTPLHFALQVEGSRLPPALLRTQVEVLLREIATSTIP